MKTGVFLALVAAGVFLIDFTKPYKRCADFLCFWVGEILYPAIVSIDLETRPALENIYFSVDKRALQSP